MCRQIPSDTPVGLFRGSVSTFVSFDEWHCCLTADCPSAIARLRRVLRTSPQGARRVGACAIHTRFQGVSAPRVRVEVRGRGLDLEEILSGPEANGFVRLRHPERRLFANMQVGDSPVLEALDGEFAILERQHWLAYVQWMIHWLTLREMPAVSIHAAVCSVDDTALVLVGPSGAGKSTLCWALHQIGARFFGDEFALFRLPECRLRVLPRDLCLRPGGAAVLAAPPRAGSWYVLKPGDPKCAVLSPSARDTCPEDRVHLVFLDGFGEQSHLEPMSGGDAALRLFQGMAYGEPSVRERLEVAAALVNRYPSCRLTVGRPERTAALLAERVRQHG